MNCPATCKICRKRFDDLSDYWITSSNCEECKPVKQPESTKDMGRRGRRGFFQPHEKVMKSVVKIGSFKTTKKQNEDQMYLEVPKPILEVVTYR